MNWWLVGGGLALAGVGFYLYKRKQAAVTKPAGTPFLDAIWGGIKAGAGNGTLGEFFGGSQKKSNTTTPPTKSGTDWGWLGGTDSGGGGQPSSAEDHDIFDAMLGS